MNKLIVVILVIALGAFGWKMFGHTITGALVFDAEVNAFLLDAKNSAELDKQVLDTKNIETYKTDSDITTGITLDGIKYEVVKVKELKDFLTLKNFQRVYRYSTSRPSKSVEGLDMHALCFESSIRTTCSLMFKIGKQET